MSEAYEDDDEDDDDDMDSEEEDLMNRLREVAERAQRRYEERKVGRRQ